jgi:DNA-3-methyladenine glycosylase
MMRKAQLKSQTELDWSRLVVVPRQFYDRDPRKVARELLGKMLLRRDGGKILAGRIVELEAYLGVDDAAAHAASGRTARNAVLWGPPGHAYVYFIYGNYYCLNVSCLPDGVAGCLLFRALEPLAGLARMARHRGISELSGRGLRMLTSGPGRLCQALAITRARDNAADMTSRRSGLWIADDGYRPEGVANTTRVGITKSAAAMLRYYIAGNAFVSGPRKD